MQTLSIEQLEELTATQGDTVVVDKNDFEIYDHANGYYSVCSKNGHTIVAGGDSANEDDYNFEYIKEIFDNWDGTLYFHDKYGFKIAE